MQPYRGEGFLANAMSMTSISTLAVYADARTGRCAERERPEQPDCYLPLESAKRPPPVMSSAMKPPIIATFFLI